MSSEQKPFEPAKGRFAAVEFAMNPEPRCPCILLLDTSGSMGGDPIESLNEGLKQFQTELQGDSLASKRVEVCIYTFGPVKKVVDFVSAGSFTAPKLMADGLTPMGEAINAALDALEARKATYKQNGVSYYRPWVFLMTDGEPTDDVEAAAKRVREAEAKKAVAFFAVGVEEADMTALSTITTRPPMKLKGLAFAELFSWLSTSLQRVSQSQVGEVVSLPAVGWNEV
jgi:uncharacterized protein YegL